MVRIPVGCHSVLWSKWDACERFCPAVTRWMTSRCDAADLQMLQIELIGYPRALYCHHWKRTGKGSTNTSASATSLWLWSHWQNVLFLPLISLIRMTSGGLWALQLDRSKATFHFQSKRSWHKVRILSDESTWTFPSRRLTTQPRILKCLDVCSLSFNHVNSWRFSDNLKFLWGVPRYVRTISSMKRLHQLNSAPFLPRCMECRRSLAMRILSVRPSVTRVLCDKMVKRRSIFLYDPMIRKIS